MYIILGFGKHQDHMKPYHAIMGNDGDRVKFKSLKQCQEEIKWHEKNNSYAECKIYKIVKHGD